MARSRGAGRNHELDPDGLNGGPSTLANPTASRDTADPGDATGRNFRYQYAYGAMLLVASKRGHRPYIALWCEQREDFLAERHDGVFDAYQIKTKRPENGPWTLGDEPLTKSIGRFVDLVQAFGEKIGTVFFVSNAEFDSVSNDNRDSKRRGRCPEDFLKHVRTCSEPSAIAAPYLSVFQSLAATCGCSDGELLAVLKRLDFVVGPSRREFDASLSNEHIACLDECRSCTAGELNGFRDELVAAVHRASTLQVTYPIRHLRPLIDADDPDPTLEGKRLVVAETVVFKQAETARPRFRYPGAPALEIGKGVSNSVIEQKLEEGGLADQVTYLRERALAAEYNLLEDIEKRPERFPDLLQQIEQRVHGEISEAYLRARMQPLPYGPIMLIDVQERLRRLAQEQADDVGGHTYECLVGVAGLLTSECRVWWSPRFAVREDSRP